MGKYTPKEYMRFTKGHCKHLLEDYAVRACDDLHGILEEWELQEYDDVDPAVWSYRASITYRLRDMQSQKPQGKQSAPQARPTQRRHPHHAEMIRKQSKAQEQDHRIATEAIRRTKERDAKKPNSPTTGRQEQLRDTAPGYEEWRPGTGKRDPEGR